MRRFVLVSVLAITLLLALPVAAHAAPVFVSVFGSDVTGDGSPGNPFATVQPAIDAASSGDDVYVGMGTFVGDVAMKDGVSLDGTGAGDTTLQGTGAGSVVTASGIGDGEAISGFTITGGNANDGGAIYCNSSSPSITNNTITGNSASSSGAIYCNSSSPSITNNTITGNSATFGGGGICCYSSSSPTITNCILWDNGDDLQDCSATYSDIEDGDAGLGNISADPGFVDSATAGYRLTASSPCINAATSTVAPAMDKDGVYRPQGAGIDMGAYEYFVPASAAPVDPALSSATHAQGVWSNDIDVTIDIAGALGTVADVDGFAISVSMNTTEYPVPVVTHDASTVEYGFTAMPDGVYYFNIATVDVAGNWSAGAHYGPIMIDTVAPTVSDDAPTGVQSSGVDVKITAVDAASGIDRIETEVVAPSGTTTASVSATSTNIAVTEEGDTTITYTAFDVAGNASAPTSVTVTLDLSVEGASVAGANRYATAIETSKRSHPDGSDAVVIATGENWPDALGGSGLAGVLDAPVLLTKRGTLLAEVAAEITRLGATEVYVLGGEEALSSDVEDGLAAMLGADDVHRIGGATRYETAELIAEEVVSLQTEYDGTVFVATGENFADALAASPLAAANGWPVYLAPQPVISADTIAAMQTVGVTDVIVLGGEAAMPADTSITLLSVGFNAVRIDGADRYETASKVAAYGVDSAGLRWNGVALAKGDGFADALCGGAAQGQAGSVMLLTRTDSLPTATSDALTANESAVSEVTFFGGLSAISQAVRDQVISLF